MSHYWIPAPPPANVRLSDQTEEKDHHSLLGTNVKIHFSQTQILYIEIVDEPPIKAPFGLPNPPFPPHPTGAKDWRNQGPHIRISADIHLSPAAVEQMASNEELFATIMATFTSGAAAIFFELGHQIYKFGLDHAKNADGSLDIHLTNIIATAGGNPILLPASTCAIILQTL
jgi:hypothetical protein